MECKIPRTVKKFLEKKMDGRKHLRYITKMDHYPEYWKEKATNLYEGNPIGRWAKYFNRSLIQEYIRLDNSQMKMYSTSFTQTQIKSTLNPTKHISEWQKWKIKTGNTNTVKDMD